ncbi:MAG: tannase/feruloyl esterase family alpha/beta hydrolase [Pseudomonadales bacterium]
MNRLVSATLFSMLLGLGTPAGSNAAGMACDTLAALALPDVRVNRSVSVDQPVAHCKVEALIGDRIGVSIWLPEAWNGRFVMGGSGGFVSPEDNQALRLAGGVLEAGYATASTDTGHRADGMDGSWALGDLEAIVNYGHVAMHRAVVTSKAVVAAHYGNPPGKSFFFGCSNGGRQALGEAQRYPNDFDAIIAGAPALDFPGVAASFAQITAAMYPDPAALSTPLVTPEDRRRLRAAIEAHCDANDGVKDGILQDPAACDFDPGSLACPAGGDGDCLPEEKVAAIRRVYEGPVSGAGTLHVGFPFGAEATDANGWGSWLTGGAAQGDPSAAFAFGVGFMRYFLYHDPAWSYVGYDWSRFERDSRPLAAVLNAENPDLSAFRAQGGKLLMYHGWADVALSARMSIDYVERAYALDDSSREDLRLFMMPGVLHCAGGAGPWRVDFLEALEAWHASGVAPDELTAAYADRPGTRRLCAWPQQAHFVQGNPDTVEAWECR